MSTPCWRLVLSIVGHPEDAVSGSPEGHERLAGIRVRRDRTVSLWVQLPSDMLGTIVDAEDIAGRTAHLLRLAADLDLSKSDEVALAVGLQGDRKSTRLNSSHVAISYAVFCLKKKK